MLIMKIPFFSGLIKKSRRAGTCFVVAISGNGVHFAHVKYVAGRPQVVTYAYHQLAGAKSAGVSSFMGNSDISR